MSLNKNKILIYFSLFLSPIAFAQEIKTDSTNIEELKEVVVTGQLNPQSVKKSVFEVKVIKRKQIEQQAANNLADLLNQTLNINILYDSGTGKSGVSLFGLDSQYFKVLIDNIPVINEDGFGNNTDLTLMNLDDIEQIEIVEGSMGVQYGANAVSGVINIITKKGSKGKTDIRAYLQEETVGKEYEWFDKGRHIQSLHVGHNFTNEFYANLTATRNDFAGFWNDRQGEQYDVNDGLRGHEWLPKLQNNVKTLLNYKKGELNLFYKFDYFNETLNKYNSIVDENQNSATDTSDPIAIDEKYTNNRFYHHLNALGKINNKINYDVSLSYQEQTKDLERYNYRIREDQQINTILDEEYLSRSTVFSRGTFSNLIASEKFNLQGGYELNFIKGSGSPYAVTVAPGEEKTTQNLNNYDVFASSEIVLNEKFSLRPGARISFSNLFDNQYMISLSSKYLMKNGFELRAVVGTAPRTPNYDELYTYFVDSNHDVQGNPNLQPEKGLSTFIHLKKTSFLKDDQLQLNNKISASYMDVSDRIELVVASTSPLAYTYNNIDSYKSVGLFSENEIQYGGLRASLGASLLGISKIFDRDVTPSDDFLYNFQLNANVNYLVPKWETTFSLYFKHVGKQHQFVEDINNEGQTEYFKGTTEAYSWMDATIMKSFFNKKIVTTLGVRNLLDVTSVDTSAFAGGAHSENPRSISLNYGRSFFLKLAYNLNL
ncbi:MAG: TonB-dependent receptor plug domain-containing protein [Xanthomarina gelatinilytica]|uniref:TonB-dependent receptor plug domain-containing protein n=1 Tax=Xanthomarina gelatinilytica TaxID=1137281 RepID=UPI003A885E49